MIDLFNWTKGSLSWKKGLRSLSFNPVRPMPPAGPHCTPLRGTQFSFPSHPPSMQQQPSIHAAAAAAAIYPSAAAMQLASPFCRSSPSIMGQYLDTKSNSQWLAGPAIERRPFLSQTITTTYSGNDVTYLGVFPVLYWVF